MYYIRLDDACEHRHLKNWDRIEDILDAHNIKPLVGIIPNCEDNTLLEYECDSNFWARVASWINKGWTPALHGYTHVYLTEEGGLNPVQKRSEFAGLPIEIQKEKILKAVEILNAHGVDPKVFFAPSHTFDENTIAALKECSNIRIISDTVAAKPYKKYGMTFIPQQSGQVRKLPLPTVTFCYHPNTMQDKDFDKLDVFIRENRALFRDFEAIETSRKPTLLDAILKKLYFARR